MTSEGLYQEGEERFGPVFSFLYGALGGFFLWKYHKTIVDDLKSSDFHKLLDVGCGSGELILKLSKVKNECSFFCVDPSESMLKVARRKVRRMGSSVPINLKIGSSRDIPFSEKFDAIISSFSYHHWKDRDSSLKSLVGYLSEGGFIGIYEYDNDLGRMNNSHGIRGNEWDSLVLEGFKKKC